MATNREKVIELLKTSAAQLAMEKMQLVQQLWQIEQKIFFTHKKLKEYGQLQEVGHRVVEQ